MKAIHYRFATEIHGMVSADDVFEGTMYENEGFRLDANQMARIFDSSPSLATFLDGEKCDVTQFVPQELKESILKITLGDYALIDGKLYFIHHVWFADHEDTPENVDAVDSYITGQLSDGWGEGLEQRPFGEETVRWDKPYFDEYSLEFDREECRVDAAYYVVPWDDGKISPSVLDMEPEDFEFSIKEIAQLELDTETRNVYMVQGQAALAQLFKDADTTEWKQSPVSHVEVDDDVPLYILIGEEVSGRKHVYPAFLQYATPDSVFFLNNSREPVCRCDVKYGLQQLLFI